MVSRIGKKKQDFNKDLLTPLADILALIGKPAMDTNQLRRDTLKSRLPAKLR